MKKILIPIHFCLWALSLAPFVRADNITEELVLQVALAHSPAVAQVDAQIAQELATAKTLSTIPNPELEGKFSTATHDTGEKSDDGYQVEISQPLPISSLRLRQLVSDLMKQAGSASQKLALLELREEVKLSFAQVWAQAEALRRLDGATARAERYAKQIRDGQSRGLFADGEAKLFYAEAKQRKAQHLAIAATRYQTIAQLTRLASYDLSGKTLRRPEMRKLPTKEVVLAALSEGTLSIQLREKLRAQLASKQLLLANRDALPGITPRVGFEHTDDGDDRIHVGLSVALPFFDRHQGIRLESEAQNRAQFARQRYFGSEEFKSEVTALLKRAELKRDESSLFESEIIPLLTEALSAFEKQLHAGQGVLLQLWEAQQELSEAEQQALSVWLEARQIESELQVLIGEES